MRDLVRDWTTSFVSFARGHGGGGRASTSVGAGFVIASLVLAIIGLRWINTSGGSEEAGDNTPWAFDETAEAGPTTTIPATSPARVVPVKDPDPDGDDPEATPTTAAKGQTGVFLPGFSPTPGGGTGPSTTLPPHTTTTRPRGSSSIPGGGTTTSPTTGATTTTEAPTTTTTEATTTTTEETTTTTEDTTPPPPVEAVQDFDLQKVKVDVNGALDALGWPFA